MRRSSLVTLVLMLASAAALCQSSPILLHDGQPLTLTGTLVMEPAGRLQFVTVKTTAAYVPVFKGEAGGKEQGGEVLHEIGLAGYADYALLYAHRGQEVTIEGKMATDQATPYFWHGTRLQVTSLRLADGTDLLGSSRSAQPVAADTGTYTANVTLPADLAAPWIYRVNGQPAQAGRFLSCSSNGGGDVVNCFCAKGLHPVQASAGSGGKQLDSSLLDQGGPAQFSVGEDAQQVEISVTCSH